MDRDRAAAPSRRWYRRTRDLHLYLGLFLSPFVLLYALSAIVLAHAWYPGVDRSPEPVLRQAVVAVPEEENSLELAKRVLDQVGVSGDIGWLDRDAEEQTLSFPVSKPGQEMRVRVDLASGLTEIERTTTGAWNALVMLHKKPGPHNLALRGNWFPLRVWAWLADATSYLLLFLTATGVYLWLALRAERRTGILFAGAGAVSFVLLVLAIAA